MSRIALVTGAASGIGASITQTLKGDGWTIAGLDLLPDCHSDYPIIADVTESGPVAAAIGSVQKDVGPIDAVVTAAGHYSIAPVADITDISWTRMLRVHLGGLRNVACAALPGMIDRGHGSIVAIASELAIGGGDGEAHYSAAKGCVLGFVRSLAVEVASQGVRVNAVAPGPTDTPMLSADSPWRQPQYLATLPNRRLCRPDEVAQVVQFLLDDAGFCVGEVLSPNCGAVI